MRRNLHGGGEQGPGEDAWGPEGRDTLDAPPAHRLLPGGPDQPFRGHVMVLRARRGCQLSRLDDLPHLLDSLRTWHRTRDRRGHLHSQIPREGREAQRGQASHSDDHPVRHHRSGHHPSHIPRGGPGPGHDGRGGHRRGVPPVHLPPGAGGDRRHPGRDSVGCHQGRGGCEEVHGRPLGICRGQHGPRSGSDIRTGNGSGGCRMGDGHRLGVLRRPRTLVVRPQQALPHDQEERRPPQPEGHEGHPVRRDPQGHRVHAHQRDVHGPEDIRHRLRWHLRRHVLQHPLEVRVHQRGRVAGGRLRADTGVLGGTGQKGLPQGGDWLQVLPGADD